MVTPLTDFNLYKIFEFLSLNKLDVFFYLMGYIKHWIHTLYPYKYLIN